MPLDASRSVTTVSSYNATNDLLTRSEADNDAAVKEVTRYIYDAAGHLTSVDVNCTASGTTPPTDASTCSRAGTADAATNLVTAYAYTANDQLAFEQDPLGRVTRHVYDAAARVVKRKMSTFGVKRTAHRAWPNPTLSPAEAVRVLASP